MVWGSKALVFVVLPLSAACALMMYYLFKKDDDEWQEYIKSLSHVCVEVKVPKESVGALIGRGGSNIREIHEKTGARISFKEDSDSQAFRICKIKGLKQNVEIAEQLIKESVKLESSLQTLKMWVPSQACGRIIGRSGDNIRAIGNASNAIINLDKFTNSEDRKLLTIRGTDDQIQAAKSLIELKIKEEEDARNKVNNRSPLKRISKAKKIDPGFEKLEVSNGTSIQVYVSAVADPNHFFIQHVKPVELDHLVENMTEYYSVEANQEQHRLSKVDIGDIVALCNKSVGNKWYRVKIMAIISPDSEDSDMMVDVLYLDYGESSYEKLEDLCFLKDDYLNVKFQAIDVYMPGIVPKDKSKIWSEESIRAFEDLVLEREWQMMMAEVIGWYPKYDGTLIPSIRLYNPERETSDIAKRMVELGMADSEKEENTDSQNEVKSDSATIKTEEKSTSVIEEPSVLDKTVFEDSLNSTFREENSETLSPPKSILNLNGIKTGSSENIEDFQSFKCEDESLSDISVDDLNMPEVMESN